MRLVKTNYCIIWQTPNAFHLGVKMYRIIPSPNYMVTLAQKYTHTQTRTHIQTQIQTQMHTHTHTHTHTQTHTHTHTHTHTP